MNKTLSKLKQKRRARRKYHIRKNVVGSNERPRLSVSRSLKHIHAQVIDDTASRTLCSAGTQEKEVRESVKYTGNKDAAAAVGRRLAEKAKAAGVSRVVFDRNGLKYHGRVKALADAAREGGLEF